MKTPIPTPAVGLSRGGAWLSGSFLRCLHWTLTWGSPLRTPGHQETSLLNWPDQGPVLGRDIRISLP